MKKTFVVYKVTEERGDTVLIWYDEFDTYDQAIDYIHERLQAPLTTLKFTISTVYSAQQQ